MGVKRLYATTDLTEAELLRALLRDQGIESTLGHEGGGVAFGIPTDEASIAINVRDEDAPAAAEALARHFEKTATEDMEADPEAPAIQPGEFDLFEEQAKAKRRYFKRRFLILLITCPVVVLAPAVAFDQPWKMAVGAAAGVLSLVAFIWFLDLIAENTMGPPPESGDGPRQKSS